MPRDGAIIFNDLIGKLDVLRLECPKCGRSGRYRLADLIMRYGGDAKLFAFTEDVTVMSSPTPIIPIIRREPFDDPAWLFDLKLDGFRGIADTVERRMLSNRQ
jgi:hypothetical protein